VFSSQRAKTLVFLRRVATGYDLNGNTAAVSEIDEQPAQIAPIQNITRRVSQHSLTTGISDPVDGLVQLSPAAWNMGACTIAQISLERLAHIRRVSLLNQKPGKMHARNNRAARAARGAFVRAGNAMPIKPSAYFPGTPQPKRAQSLKSGL
jgi:hypothetical protein